MFSNTFRSSISSTKQVYHNIFACLTQQKCIKSKVTLFVPNHCIRNNVSYVKRHYCMTHTKSALLSKEYNEKYENKLKELLKDPKYEQIYEKLKLEIEILRHSTQEVPINFRAYDWLMLLSSKSLASRRSYLRYLFVNEKSQERQEQIREERQLARSKEYEAFALNANSNQYSLHKNSMFIRITQTTMMNALNRNLINAMLYEPTIVFDLSYDEYMLPYEAQNCARQLVMSFALNRSHDNPFNLYFCNAKKNNFVMQKLHMSIPTIYDIDFPLNVTSKSYVELFDRDRLVYLSPHAREVVNTYDPDMIYIIGAMVDKVSSQPISLLKAKESGIRVAKLPLSQYLQWGSGSSKNLPINQVLGILLDVRNTNDWNIALKHVPPRKLKYNRDKYRTEQIRNRNKMLEGLEGIN